MYAKMARKCNKTARGLDPLIVVFARTQEN